MSPTEVSLIHDWPGVLNKCCRYRWILSNERDFVVNRSSIASLVVSHSLNLSYDKTTNRSRTGMQSAIVSSDCILRGMIKKFAEKVP